jgi:hypothetical protein
LRQALSYRFLRFVLFLGGGEQGSFFRCGCHAVLRAGTAVGHRGEQNLALPQAIRRQSEEIRRRSWDLPPGLGSCAAVRHLGGS